jgi:NADPH:quinone reductase-like Zn-dependent oxidoreductase
MKAIVLKENGSVENLLYTEAEVPAIKADEVLVRVKAVGINPVDVFVRENEWAMKTVLQLNEVNEPVIIGWDLSGTIESVGSSVSNFHVGDDVFGMVNFKGQGKAYAEYVAAPVNHLARKPANVSHEEAAAATLAALTAWQALVSFAKVKKGDKILIHAAAGGVGHYAVQIARHFGAYVIGTASAENRDFVLSLGANEFIDYKNEVFEEKVQDADVVLDSLPGDHILRSLKAVKRGGRVITLLAAFEGEAATIAEQKDLFTHRLSVTSNGDDMAQIAALLECEELKTHLSAAYHFDEMPKAHQQIATGKTRGKIVVMVD